MFPSHFQTQFLGLGALGALLSAAAWAQAPTTPQDPRDLIVRLRETGPSLYLINEARLTARVPEAKAELLRQLQSYACEEPPTSLPILRSFIYIALRSPPLYRRATAYIRQPAEMGDPQLLPLFRRGITSNSGGILSSSTIGLALLGDKASVPAIVQAAARLPDNDLILFELRNFNDPGISAAAVANLKDKAMSESILGAPTLTIIPGYLPQR